MPAKKLDQKKLDYYKKLLVKLRDDLVHDIRNMSDNTGSSSNDSSDVSGHVQHMADVATDMYDKEFSLGLASHDREVLHKINAALKRIDDGTYGFCLATGKPISQARLKAIPYAEYCLKYQEELENSNQI
ncbi:MAG: TraR/DksA family transcriptional regulator [Candidatus Omnitrophica bacterium]|nr:TraR/DksA family transcriptional regulator [Candidatus Omnitrophota bacterium]MCA9404622.1 TraR/DksA family transcriptional regulator [Candidatus Omnitrophota bacterium]MCB9720638.1 TraR/DksA family transcriptional regulator [Candidatus Omnitrophota bacterium]